MPKISVIMPAYNHEKFVGEAVASVLGQSLADLELIVVDDGSQDDTGAVVASFDDPRLSYLRQENAGAHAAINRGLSLARGSYLTIINSDDLYAAGRLETLFNHAHTTGLGFLFSEVEFIDAGSRRIESGDPRKAPYERLMSAYEEKGDLLGTALLGNVAVTTSNFFFSRSVYEQLGSFVDYRYAHDYDYLLRALKSCRGEVAMLPERLLHYRLHGKNTVLEDAGKVLLERYRVLGEHLAGFMSCDLDRSLADSFLRPILVRAGEEIASVTTTRSWQLTAPLRRLAEAVQHVTGSVSR
jgi:glycosyltransferase involved in cell wall biosynthesis